MTESHTRRVSAAQIAALVRAALQAPSGDNCQPWRFTWGDAGLAIHFQPQRAASLYDANGRASWIALGAALTNIEIAARPLGLRVTRTLFPRGPGENPVAVCALEPGSPAEEPLATAIEARCANRRPYASTALPREARAALLASADQAPGIRLDLIEERASLARLARLASLNDRVLFENEELRSGLYQWLRWTTAHALQSGDGLPVGSLELSAYEQPGFRLLGTRAMASVCRSLRLTALLPLKAQRIYQHSAAIGLLQAGGVEPEAFVRAGMTLERLWLTATARGLAFQPITGLICLWWRCQALHGKGLSPAHQRLIDSGMRQMREIIPSLAETTPVMLFRIGQAPAPSARALRRPIEAVLHTQEAHDQPI